MKRLTNSWNVFFAMVVGVLLLMASARPELQGRAGDDQNAPASTIKLAGHVLTWTTATVLVYRMVEHLRQRDRDAKTATSDVKPPPSGQA